MINEHYGTYSGRDYLFDKRNAELLVGMIRSYWAKRNRSPKVWVESEKYVTGDSRPRWRYVVRSNIKLRYE